MSKSKEAPFVDRAAEKVLTRLVPPFGSEDLVVRDRAFFRRVLVGGSLEFGEAYMRGEWEHPDLSDLIYRIVKSKNYPLLSSVYSATTRLRGRLSNLQNREGAREVIKEHYDLPPSFFKAWLGPHMQYSCLDFTGTEDIRTAERQNMAKICDKLGLKSGDQVIDFGGGWGGLARFMADEYGAIPTVVTLSESQADYIRETHPDRVKVIESDYRDLPGDVMGRFDAASSIEMVEAIGHKNLEDYFSCIAGTLRPGARFCMQGIFMESDYPTTNPYMNKYTFPNHELLSSGRMKSAMGECFRPVDVTGENPHPPFEEKTPHYYHTLTRWAARLREAHESGATGISDEEFRMHELYLMFCAGGVKADHIRVAQFLGEKR